jgi:hypothetical protein
LPLLLFVLSGGAGTVRGGAGAPTRRCPSSQGIGFAGSYAASVDELAAWIAASRRRGLFLLLAGVNHIIEIIRDKNYAPGNTAILLSDLGTNLAVRAVVGHWRLLDAARRSIRPTGG